MRLRDQNYSHLYKQRTIKIHKFSEDFPKIRQSTIKIKNRNTKNIDKKSISLAKQKKQDQQKKEQNQKENIQKQVKQEHAKNSSKKINIALSNAFYPKVKNIDQDIESKASSDAIHKAVLAKNGITVFTKNRFRKAQTKDFRKKNAQEIRIKKAQIKSLKIEFHQANKIKSKDDSKPHTENQKNEFKKETIKKDIIEKDIASKTDKSKSTQENSKTKKKKSKKNTANKKAFVLSAQVAKEKKELKELKNKRKANKSSNALGEAFANSILQKSSHSLKNSIGNNSDNSASNYAQEQVGSVIYQTSVQTHRKTKQVSSKILGKIKTFNTKKYGTGYKSDTPFKKQNSFNKKADNIRTSNNKKTDNIGIFNNKKAETAVKNTENKANLAKSITKKKAFVKAQEHQTKQVAIQAQKIAIKNQRRVAEFIKRTITAMYKAVKSLLLAGASGLMFFLIFALITGFAVAFASPWGIFYGNEDKNEKGLLNAVTELSEEWATEFMASGGENTENDIGSEISGIPNLYEILCVYAVKVSSDPTNPLDVATMTPEKKELLKQVINDMRSITTETVTITDTDENGNQTQRTETQAVVDMKSWQEMIEFYNFDDDQAEALEQLINEDSMFKHLMGSLGFDVIGDSSGQLTDAEWNDLIKDLGNIDDIQASIIAYARQFLGFRYSQPLRGQSYTENGTTKMYLDCSFFTRHVYRKFGIEIAGTAGEQLRWAEQNNVTVSTSNLEVGDLVFFSTVGNTSRYKGISHVGIYIGNGKMIDASSSRGQVIIRDIWKGGKTYLHSACRPLATQKS